MPGLVDANAQYGRRGDANEQSSEVTPDFSLEAALDPASLSMQRAVRLGVTTARIAPGNQNVVTGHGVVIKPGATSLSSCLLRPSSELRVVLGQEPADDNNAPWVKPTSFHFRQPNTSMGVVWILRQALAKAQTAVARHQPLGPDLKPLAEALQAKTPVHMSLRCAVDVETAFTIADEFGLTRLVFEECTEGYKLAAEIARRKIPVILGPIYVRPSTYLQATEGQDVSWNNAGLLARAGVVVAIASNQPGEPASLLLWAALAARGGLARDLALRAVTLTPAEILGVADRVGSLAPGKDADLLIVSGDPLAVTSRLEQVILGGHIAFDAGSETNAKG
jgi:imidazolonepropionase-like amidohydrolase